MRLHGIDRLVLGLVLLALALFAARRLEAPPDPPLTRLDPQRVQEIRVLQDGHLRLALLRDAGGWMLTHPRIRRARPARVASLLALLRAPSRARWPADPALRRQAGLDRPGRELRFDGLSLRFGRESTPPGRRYLEAEGRIHLVDAFWYDLAGLPASHFEAP